MRKLLVRLDGGLDDEPRSIDSLDLEPFALVAIGAGHHPERIVDPDFPASVHDRLMEHIGAPDIVVHALIEIGGLAFREFDPRAYDEDEEHRNDGEKRDLDLPRKIGEEIDDADRCRGERQPHEEHAGKDELDEK